MKRNVLCAAMVLLAGSLMAADKDDVSAAIAKLAAADNYSWKSSVSNVPPPDAGGGGGGGFGGGFGRRGGGATSGKTQKDGLMYVSQPGRGGNMEGYIKAGKVAMKAGDDGAWSSLAEATADDGGGGFNMNAMRARQLETQKTPADTAKDLLEKTKSVAKSGDAYSGDLTEEGAKGLMAFGGFGGRGGGGGGQGPEISGAKGTVKFWVKDGALVKFETHVEGNMSFNGNDIPRNTITTTEISDVGSTKIDMPDDAKKKLGS